MEYIVTAVIVAGAVLFLTRGFWKRSANCEKSGCGCFKADKKPSKQ